MLEKIKRICQKYKWWISIWVVAWVILLVLLVVLTQGPQAEPFSYQIR